MMNHARCSLSVAHNLQDVLDICLQWSSPAHLDVDEITSAPIFEKTLNLVWSEYERPSFQQFAALLK